MLSCRKVLSERHSQALLSDAKTPVREQGQQVKTRDRFSSYGRSQRLSWQMLLTVAQQMWTVQWKDAEKRGHRNVQPLCTAQPKGNECPQAEGDIWLLANSTSFDFHPHWGNPFQMSPHHPTTWIPTQGSRLGIQSQDIEFSSIAKLYKC